MGEPEPLAVMPAIMSLRAEAATVRVCPSCWDRREVVPLLLEVAGTVAFVLPDGTEVQRLAGSYRFCVRCSWSDTTGVVKATGGEG